MNPYGRKGKSGTPANAAAEKQKHESEVQKQLLALQAENEELRRKLIDQHIAEAGGSITLMPPPDDNPEEIPLVEGVRDDRRANFGPVWTVRVFSDKAPAGVRIPLSVAVGKKAPNGKADFFRRRFYTDTPVDLPEDAIKVLETPEEREFFEESGGTVYEAAMRGDMGPAKEACHKMGFEEVRWLNGRLQYVAYIRHYTVSRIAKKNDSLIVPV